MYVYNMCNSLFGLAPCSLQAFMAWHIHINAHRTDGGTHVVCWQMISKAIQIESEA